MKRKKTGFTLVELLTVLAIITMLVGLLVPSMSMVRRLATNTKQKAQLTSIGLALTAFRDDDGDYPPSHPFSDKTPVWDYCGAQKLAEALLGRDLLGFHPQSNWSATDGTFYPPNPDLANLDARRDRYLELGTANAFKVGDLFANPVPLAPNTYVICDSFPKKVTVGGQTVKAGTPILYYRANTSSKQMVDDPGDWDYDIYNIRDNRQLLGLGKIDDTIGHPLVRPEVFYSANGGVIDPKVAVLWPYRPDSYILISAGTDGRYGTADDITNFGN